MEKVKQPKNMKINSSGNAGLSPGSIRRVLVNTILLYAFWVALAGFERGGLLFGGLVVIVCQLLFAPRLKLFRDLRYDPGSAYAFLCFCGAFSQSLFSSNIDVAMRVINPRLPIAPGILEIKTALKADLAIMLVSYAITLTPGTIMIETRDDSLFVHAINVDSVEAVDAIKATISRYERFLSRMFI